MNHEGGNSHGQETEYASFRPDRATRQPRSAVQSRAGKMVVKHIAAVGNRKEKRLAKVKAGVPADGKPQIPGSSQRERKHQARDRDIGRSDDSLARVSQVSGPKHKRERHGGRPESNPSRQSVLRVSAKQKLLRQPYK